MARPHYAFRSADLVGGHVVLDLVNTVTGRDATPTDWLDRYPSVLEWAALTGHFERGVLAKLERLDAADPGAGTRALLRLVELREAVHDVLAAMLRGEPPPAAALGGLEAQWKDAVAHASLAGSGRGTGPRLGVDSSGLDYPRHELALRAVELLGTYPADRTRVCDGPRCGWIFIDRSKAGRRRWCDMATCGNAAKSRRHAERRRASRSRR
jgi:predicted RNA-binding Zn ribbon-like protein